MGEDRFATWLVCLFVCLSVQRLQPKRPNGFDPNLVRTCSGCLRGLRFVEIRDSKFKKKKNLEKPLFWPTVSSFGAIFSATKPKCYNPCVDVLLIIISFRTNPVSLIYEEKWRTRYEISEKCEQKSRKSIFDPSYEAIWDRDLLLTIVRSARHKQFSHQILSPYDQRLLWQPWKTCIFRPFLHISSYRIFIISHAVVWIAPFETSGHLQTNIYPQICSNSDRFRNIDLWTFEVGDFRIQKPRSERLKNSSTIYRESNLSITIRPLSVASIWHNLSVENAHSRLDFQSDCTNHVT